MATVTGTRRLLDISGNNISTAVSLEAEGTLLDSNGQSGTSNQVLISTATGVDWVDGSGSGIIGGPYLPLAGGTMTGTNGVLMPDNFKLNLGTGNDFQLYHDGTHGVLNNTTGNLYTSAQGSMMFRTSLNVTALTLDASQNAVFYGNVGIGTTAPGAKLDVEGRVDFSNDLRLRGTDSSANQGVSRFYVDSSNKLFIDTANDGSNLFVIDSSGNVGIGTTNPGAKLSVLGTSSITGSLTLGTTAGSNLNMLRASANYINATNATGYLVFRTSGYDTALILDTSQNATFAGDVTIPQYLKHANDADTYFGFSASNQVLFHVGGSDRLIINSAGNVGIGTTSPNSGMKLEVVGNIRTNVSNGKGFAITGTTGVTSGLVRSDGTGVALRTSDTDRVTVDLNGNVGIGTTSPSRPLSVYRSTAGSAANFLHYTDATAFAGLYIDVDNVNNIVELNASGDTASTMAFQTGNAERMRITTTGNVGIGTTSPGHKLSVIGGHIQTDGNVYTNVIRDNTGGNVSIQDNGGNVGIGTASPAYKLDIYGGNIQINNGGATWLGSDSTGGFARTFNGNTFRFISSSNSETVRIDNATGNVGIGVTSPSTVGGTAKLTVNVGSGTSSPVSIVNGTTDGMYIRRYAVNGQYQIQTTSGSGNSGNLSLQSYGGNVGIGTTSPGSKLEVSSGVGANGDSILTISADTDNSTSSSSPKLLMLQKGSTKTSLIEMDSSDRTHFSNATGYYFSGGNVGIGTTSPSYKLDVNGVVRGDRFFVGTNTAASQWAFHARNNNSTADSGLYFNNNSSEIYLRNSSNVIGARIRSNSASYFNGGDVGIGTASPQERLHVSGETHPSIKLSSSSDGNYNVILNCGYRNEALNLSVGGYKVFTTEGFNTPETTHLYSNNSKALSLASNQAATFTSTVTATNFINSSDKRLKENIEEVRDNNVEVNWKTFNFKTEKEQKRYGVIAQELEKTNPEFVREDSQGFKSVAYIDLLIAKIAELEARIQKLEK